jgi:hypothetical protein
VPSVVKKTLTKDQRSKNKELKYQNILIAGANVEKKSKNSSIKYIISYKSLFLLQKYGGRLKSIYFAPYPLKGVFKLSDNQKFRFAELLKTNDLKSLTWGVWG